VLRYLYSFLLYLAMPFMFLRLLWRSRKVPEYRTRFAERLGFFPETLSKSIWLHAVSVGESLAAIPLIKSLKKTYPDIPIVVTNMTPTGRARIQAALGDSVLQSFVPYDFPDAVSRFLKKTNPIVCIVMETELWPNLFSACKKNKIPMVVTNARLSEKSAKGYQAIAPLTREMLSAVNILASQGIADAERFIALGMKKENVHVTGNLKFDLELPADLAQKSENLKNQLGKNKLIWVAASTHPTEEEIVLAAHRKILKKNPDALLILVPRHPDRFNSVAELIKQQGFSLTRRSDAEFKPAEVYLADTMGELLLMYSVCDVAFVAGSFANIGGHNMLEAAALAKPIIVGPQLFNFAEISEKLFAANAMIKVLNDEELAIAVTKFFNDEHFRKQVGDNALRVVDENRGALKKQMNLISSLIA